MNQHQQHTAHPPAPGQEAPAPGTAQTSGRWYGREHSHPEAVEVLQALSTYQAADAALRRRAAQALGMSEKDLTALRHLLEAERTGRPLAPGELARTMGISSASVTTLLDRLTKGGHITRRPHPTDRRALVVVATPEAGTRLQAVLEAAYQQMIDAAAGLDPDHARAVAAFLHTMARTVESIPIPSAARRPTADRPTA